MLFKLVIIVMMIFIVWNLFSAARYLVKSNKSSREIAKALSWRIGLSLLLFFLLFVAYGLGWITPHGIS